jgi:hypothetical protein
MSRLTSGAGIFQATKSIDPKIASLYIGQWIPIYDAANVLGKRAGRHCHEGKLPTGKVASSIEIQL